jgi:hypothetical protein
MQDVDSILYPLSCNRNLTPEFSRAEHKAFKMKKPNNDERHAVEASAAMSCSGALATVASAERSHSTPFQSDHSTHQPTLKATQPSTEGYAPSCDETTNL